MEHTYTHKAAKRRYLAVDDGYRAGRVDADALDVAASALERAIGERAAVRFVESITARRNRAARRAAALSAREAERSCNGSPLAFRLTLPEAESALADDEANEWAAMERRADALARLIEAERGAERGAVFVEADNVNLYAYEYRNAREAERQLSTGGGDHVATFGSGEGWDWLQDGVARPEAAFYTVWRQEAATAQS